MILIVEDDENIRAMESYALRSSGFETVECENGAELDAALRGGVPQMILLDLMLPGEDGLSILRRLRAAAATAAVPVIIVSAKAEELDAVRGLDSGADDYITKPFGIMELLSRVRAVLRRTESTPGKNIRLGGIVFDDERREVARRLRENAEAHPKMSLILNLAFADDSLKPDGSMEWKLTPHDAARRIAALMEPTKPVDFDGFAVDRDALLALADEMETADPEDLDVAQVASSRRSGTVSGVSAASAADGRREARPGRSRASLGRRRDRSRARRSNYTEGDREWGSTESATRPRRPPSRRFSPARA